METQAILIQSEIGSETISESLESELASPTKMGGLSLDPEMFRLGRKPPAGPKTARAGTMRPGELFKEFAAEEVEEESMHSFSLGNSLS